MTSKPATPKSLQPTNSHEYATVPPAAPLEVRAYLAALGRMGGQRTSEAKRKAARRNGRRHKSATTNNKSKTMKTTTTSLLATLVALFTTSVRADAINIGWQPPAGGQLITNVLTNFEGVTNYVIVYPAYTGFAIYYSPVLTTNLSAFTRIMELPPTATNAVITNLPTSGQKFLTVVTTNVTLMQSTPSNLIQLNGNAPPKVLGVVAQ